MADVDQRSDSRASPIPAVDQDGVLDAAAPNRRYARVRDSWWSSRVAIAIAVPLAVFVVFRPEQYGLTPNPNDPVFYTGYAINFDDVVRDLGQSWYFVTRWPAYVSQLWATALFGPVAGRLLLRWLVSALMVLSILHFARRWQWSRQTDIVVATTVLTTPMFLRSFMTDYSEWVVISVGVILICQCLEQRTTTVRSLGIGVLAALIVISNPFGMTIVAPAVLVYLAASWVRHHRVVETGLWITLGASATVLSGWLAFRVLYGLPNIYEPTIDYMQGFAATTDRWRSPGFSWMTEHLWIFVPVVIASAIVVLPPARERFRASRAAAAALALMMFEYVWQFFDRFVRTGLSLEVTYYWSYIIPSLLVTWAILLSTISWTPRRTAAFLAAWTGVIVLGRYSSIEVPAGSGFVVMMLIVGGTLVLVAKRSPQLVLACGLLLVLILQVAAPSPARWDPEYAAVFFDSPDSESRRDFDEIRWLERELDALPTDEQLYFLPSGDAWNIVGIYVPQITRRLLSLPDGALRDDAPRRLQSGEIERLAVLGDEAHVASATSVVEELSPSRPTTIADAVNPGGHGFHLRVLELPRGDYEWDPSELPSQTGTVEGSARSAAPPDERGFIVFGQNTRLERGDHRATLVYSSDAPRDQPVGVFDVAIDAVRTHHVTLPGTGGERVETFIDFPAVEGIRHEFRVYFDGVAPLTTWQISLEALD